MTPRWCFLQVPRDLPSDFVSLLSEWVTNVVSRKIRTRSQWKEGHDARRLKKKRREKKKRDKTGRKKTKTKNTLKETSMLRPFPAKLGKCPHYSPINKWFCMGHGQQAEIENILNTRTFLAETLPWVPPSSPIRFSWDQDSSVQIKTSR